MPPGSCVLECLCDSWPKNKILNDLFRGICQVKEKLNHIALLTIVFFITVAIYDQVITARYIDFDIVEQATVVRVG